MSGSGWADKRTVLDAVDRNGMDLQHASPELQADKEVVMEAVKADGRALQFASEELRGDKEVVLAAVRDQRAAFEYAGAELRSDKAVVLEAVVAGKEQIVGPLCIRFASDEVRADKILMLEVVKHDWRALKYASSELRADKEVVLEAAKQTGEAIRHASNDLRADKEVMLEAVKLDGQAIEHVSAELKADKEVVREAVKQTGEAIRFVREKLQADKELQVLVARCGEHGFRYVLYNCEVGLSRTNLQNLVDTALAVRGEEAPIVTLNLAWHDGGTTGSQQNEEVCTEGIFECEASLLSGLTFRLSIPDGPCVDKFGFQRPRPFLGMLAAKLVEELQNHSKATKRVFINFTSDDGSDAVSVAPWDWERPLRDFLPATLQGGASEPASTPQCPTQ